jgi:chemotaxis protein CheD
MTAYKKPLMTIHPGDWYFGSDFAKLHTILGSCVAITVWHPSLRIGGMCHYLLSKPSSAHLKTSGDSKNDFRYASIVLKEMKKTMIYYGKMQDYQIGFFGGGDMFPSFSMPSIGAENIAYAQRWLHQENLQPIKIDVGGNISRSLVLTVATGKIQMKHYVMNQL